MPERERGMALEMMADKGACLTPPNNGVFKEDLR
jgi:hypothetical protein